MNSVLNRRANIADAIYSVGKFDVIPCSIFSGRKLNPFNLRDKIRYLKKKYDFILIDSSPALNDETLAAMMASDEILVVTTPDYSTMGTTLKAIKHAKSRKTPISGLILNKVYKKKFEISPEHVEKTSGVPVMAVLPHDKRMLEAQSKFMPITHHKPLSELSQEYLRLASCLSGQKSIPPTIKSLFRKLNPQRQDINREIFYESLFIH